MDIKTLKQQFLEYLEIEKGRSLKTVENYGRYLEKFLDFAKINKPEQITDEALRNFRLFLNRQETSAGTNLNKKTQNYYLIALRMFLKYLARREVSSLPAERIELAKTPERQLDLITEAELERLLAGPDTLNSKPSENARQNLEDTLKRLRDKAILELLFSTGLRVSELCSLNREQFVNAKSGEISIRGKGGKIRIVFISDKARKTVMEYLDKRADMEEALFIASTKSQITNNKKNPNSKAQNSQTTNYKLQNTSPESRLTPRSIERIVKFYAIKAGISKKVTPHIVRHCFATDLLSAGADIRSVQTLLGHSNISTTQIYTHITDKQLRDVHKAFHGKQRRENS